jgi:hypothetical protein
MNVRFLLSALMQNKERFTKSAWRYWPLSHESSVPQVETTEEKRPAPKTNVQRHLFLDESTKPMGTATAVNSLLTCGLMQGNFTLQREIE